ncbi:fructosamine kinase family protein [Streptomyces sp. TRM 70361]|uniref:fructosamine kinase family protein n=1 Tax=Streptomyces sp. TRM 70361 TaxID=3116553 RepID=UPI002E7BDC88|nr:fructosamine kinase family protein [Streptomyces sp. TRM 70361]MEE1939567.1 fructosamine kinase family protein [Streptomyces sp. TRM 70361]
MTGTAPENRVAARVAALTGVAADRVRPVGGGDICDAHRIGSADGRTVFAKTLRPAPEGFFAAEAAGLELLAATGAVAVPRVLAAEPDVLVLEWIEPGPAGPAQAERLGRELAALHSVRAPAWGNPDPGRPAYLGSLPLPNPAEPPARAADWPAFHAEWRLLPLLRRAVDGGGIGGDDARAVARLCERLAGGGTDAAELAGPPQPPAVIHGDLWSGNVLWSAGGRAHLIDPAVQGGHPEADLAMLELFGCPHLERLLAAYEEVRPVPGRRARVPLHQLLPLLVHAVLFGSGYGARCGAAARAALAA